MINSVKTNYFPTSPLRSVEHIHFVGIGGSGMNGIAEVLITLGYKISGSDIAENISVVRLKNLGAHIVIGHDEGNILDADVVVVSSAIATDNPEIISAKEQGIPVVPRALMLAELMRFRYGIAVAGSHGKTTTTSLIASLLASANLEPTFVIGGLLNSTGSNAQLGEGRYFVAEADESDGSFRFMQPLVSIVTNIDNDHLANYDNDETKLQQAFLQFLHNLPFYGLAIICFDCKVVQKLIAEINRPYITYGIDSDADIKAINIKYQGTATNFDVISKKFGIEVNLTLNIPGKHNVLNALAAIAVALDIGIDALVVKQCLSSFQGVGRRFQIYGDFKLSNATITLVDDYGHHPSEIMRTVEAVRSCWPSRRLVMLFQPHRFTRTQQLFDDFIDTLIEVDELLLLEVYDAGEKPIANADSRSLCRSIRKRGKVEPILIADKTKLLQSLVGIIKDNDIVLTQGAGNIGTIAASLAASDFKHAI